MNKASPKVFLACATGEHLPKAILTARKAGGTQQEYLTFRFNDLFVSAYQTEGSESDLVPIDSFSLNFARIEWEYREQKPDGTLGAPVRGGWDIKANKKI